MLRVSPLLSATLLVSAALAQNPSQNQPEHPIQEPPRDGIAILSSEVGELRALVTAQQRQIELLRMQMQERQDYVPAAQLPQSATVNPELVSTSIGASDHTTTSSQNAESARDVEGPLQFHIGRAAITPVGFVDFTSVWRSKAGGSGIGTNFAGIPYGSGFQNLKEFRLSMQNSRFGFRVDADVKGAHVIGYMESDFLGNNPGNVAVSSNSNTLRSRLYWVDMRKNRWEILGGQSWSLITPGRSGISPLPGDLFFTQNIDVNYQLGLTWGRIPEWRVVYHASPRITFAVAAESPEQYVGGSAGGGLVVFPTALSNIYPGGELNNGNTTLGVPNRTPDVIVKFAADPSTRVHVEVGGVERQFQAFNPNTVRHFSTNGGGGFVNLNVEIVRGLRFITNNYWSDGGGRYIFGQAPDVIARADGSLSVIHSGSTVSGFEANHGNTLIYSYYGGLYVSRNVALDTNSKPIGYGFIGSPSGQNRSAQEGTIGFTQTFWKDPRFGGLAFMGQFSYLTRDPWFVAAGQPKNAHLGMAFVNLRYTLPGAAPRK